MKSRPARKDPGARKVEGNRGREQERMRWLDSITDSKDMDLSKLQEIVEGRGAQHAAVHEVPKTDMCIDKVELQCGGRIQENDDFLKDTFVFEPLQIQH